MAFKKGNVPWNKGGKYPAMVGNKHAVGHTPWNKGTTTRYEQSKIWRAKNTERVREWRRDFHARHKTDPHYAIACRLRKRLVKVLRGGIKKGSAVNLLGCSVPEFKFFIEGKFQDGMGWTNYGEWHLDHILPLSFFDLTDPAQLKQACHYTNFQPLWKRDNLVKGKKILYATN